MNSREKLTNKSREVAPISPPSVQRPPEPGAADTVSCEKSDVRHELIARQAYYRAEARGFTPGAELDDWLSAEAQVDAALREAPPAADRAEHVG